MRLYAYLVIALFALEARAATIPDNGPFISVTIPENVFDEKEPVDKANIIIDNKLLRDKLVETPVEVGEQILRTSDDSEEIIGPAVVLRNLGPLQHQEHETQNSKFSAEQNIMETYRRDNYAQVILKMGLEGIGEGIQNIFRNITQIKVVQKNIQKLRENFIAQINTLNGTVQTFLNADETNNRPAEDQIKAKFQSIESGLNTIQNDFTRELKSLADGIESVRTENENPEGNNPSSGATPAPVNPQRAVNYLQHILTNFQSYVDYVSSFPVHTAPPLPAPTTVAPNQAPSIQNFISNMQNNFYTGLAYIVVGFNNMIHQGPKIGSPAKAQADDSPDQATGFPTSGGGESGSGPLVQTFQNTFNQFFSPQAEITQSLTSAQPSTSHTPGPQLDEGKSTSIGPILLNNPVSQGIATLVQGLQNIKSEDNNNSNDSGVEDTELVNEV